MNDTDHAIVIGISRYPSLRPPAPGSAHDLQGPDRDAEAVFGWLIDPVKGGVPEANTLLVRSADFPNPFATTLVAGQQRIAAEPTVDQVAGCFGWLHDKAQNAPTVRLGRRLYVYFSGHGFCIDDCDGGIYTAAASPALLSHFYVRSWFDWFYRNAVFEEFVLWMDACADDIPIAATPSATWLPDRSSANSAQGRRFIVYSAKHTLRSVERRTPDGQIRGVFTYTLLEGLNGAAVDEGSGRITADSLHRFLKMSMARYMPAQDVENPEIGKAPAFGPLDDLDFGTAPVTRFARVIRFADRHVGRRAQLLNNALQPVDETVIGRDDWNLLLQVGLYKVAVDPDAHVLFAVDGEQSRAIVVP